MKVESQSWLETGRENNQKEKSNKTEEHGAAGIDS
jgi:hypothetical protein